MYEKTIYGGMPVNPAGYCLLHHGSLTVKEIKKKNCLGKQCRYFKRNENHEYWNQRRLLKEKNETRIKEVSI